VSAAERDAWAKKGWVDLRPANITRWRERISKMTRARSDLRQEGSGRRHGALVHERPF
jgi:hypothetical protein